MEINFDFFSGEERKDRTLKRKERKNSSVKIIESKILEKSKKNSLILDADSFHERTERISIWRIEKSAKMIGNRSYRRSIGKRIGRPMTTMTTTMMIQRSTIGCTQRDRRSEREGEGGAAGRGWNELERGGRGEGEEEARCSESA